MQFSQRARETAKAKVRYYFKNDYAKPFEMTDGQADIFLAIYTKAFPRVEIITYTQYGKSDIVSIALICRSTDFSEPWAIVAGTGPKASIIMERVLQHTFDHPKFYLNLEIDPNEPLERLRRERSKDRIIWLTGGGIRIFTAKAGNSAALKEALTGFGSPNIVEDEAPLIPDEAQGMVMRMLQGHSTLGVGTFLAKIGNPFYNNHFKRTYKHPRYQLILIDYRQGLAEGRISEEAIEEMREEPFFDILYECKFPPEDSVDERGYRLLFTSDELLEWQTDENLYQKRLAEEALKPESEKRLPRLTLGIDIGGGGDFNTFIMRTDNFAWIEAQNQSKDTMANIDEIRIIQENYPWLNDSDIYIDDTGIGKGVYDRLREMGKFVNGVTLGAKAEDTERYRNVKAEASWNMRLWLQRGGRLLRDARWQQLGWIKFKISTDKLIQVEPKEDLKARTGKSPDFADGLMVTFAQSELAFQGLLEYNRDLAEGKNVNPGQDQNSLIREALQSGQRLGG